MFDQTQSFLTYTYREIAVICSQISNCKTQVTDQYGVQLFSLKTQCRCFQTQQPGAQTATEELNANCGAVLKLAGFVSAHLYLPQEYTPPNTAVLQLSLACLPAAVQRSDKTAKSSSTSSVLSTRGSVCSLLNSDQFQLWLFLLCASDIRCHIK